MENAQESRNTGSVDSMLINFLNLPPPPPTEGGFNSNFSGWGEGNEVKFRERKGSGKAQKGSKKSGGGG